MKNIFGVLAVIILFAQCNNLEENYPKEIIEHSLEYEYDNAKYIIHNLNINEDNLLGVYENNDFIDTIKLVSCDLEFYNLKMESGINSYYFAFTNQGKRVIVYNQTKPIYWFAGISFRNTKPLDFQLGVSSASPKKAVNFDKMLIEFDSTSFKNHSQDFFFPYVRANWDCVNPWLKKYIKKNIPNFSPER